MTDIIKLDIVDVKQLSDLAYKAYNDSYLHIWQDNGEWYKNRTYSVENLGNEMDDPENEFYAVSANNNWIGYLKIKPQASIQKDSLNGLMLDRIYFLGKSTGKGYGKIVLDYVFEKALKLNKSYVWLNAMDTSKSAINFYERWGFEIIDQYNLDFTMLKKGFEGMVVMKKSLT